MVLAETKDHRNWELIGKCGEKVLEGEAGQLLTDAYDEIRLRKASAKPRTRKNPSQTENAPIAGAFSFHSLSTNS